MLECLHLHNIQSVADGYMRYTVDSHAPDNRTREIADCSHSTLGLNLNATGNNIDLNILHISHDIIHTGIDNNINMTVKFRIYIGYIHRTYRQSTHRDMA